MATDTIYVRNLRPNRVVLLHAGLRVILERRGSREDTTSLPSEALNEPTIARWLRAGMIEQISKEDFLDLASRTDAFDPNFRSPDEPELVSNVRSKAIPMSPEKSETPFVIDIAKLDRKELSPLVEFKDPPEASDISPQQVSIHDLHRGETGRPANLASEDRFASQENLEKVQEAPKKVTARKPATRKRTTSGRKSTKKTT